MIFLHISDDPEQVEYHVWNPRDFDFDQPSSIRNTAIAEVVAFSLQAKPPPQDWHDAAAQPEIKHDKPACKSSRSANLFYRQRLHYGPDTRLST